MLKPLKNLSFLIVVMFLLINSCFCLSVQAAKHEGIPVMTEEYVQDLTVDNNSGIKDLDIDPLNTDKVKKQIVPDTKKEGKKFIGLFVKTMMTVVLCSFVIYFIVLLIERYKKSSFVPYDEEYENEDMLELTTPKTKTDALKSFLNRTK